MQRTSGSEGKARVVGLGAGGHAKAVLDALLGDAGVELVGLLDADRGLSGRCVLGVPVLGDDRLLDELRRSGATRFFVAVGGTRDAALRRRLFRTGLAHGLAPQQVVHPTAVVSPACELGRGVTLLAGAVVNAGARLGDGVIVNTRAVVEHDCRLGDHVHVATGACLAGAVEVGDGGHVGAGAVVREGIRVGAGALVAAGAAVVEDVPEGACVAGVPARPLELRR